MVRELFCVVCAAKRSIDLASPGVPAGTPVTCFRCGGVVFSVYPPPATPRIAWFLTPFDRELLKLYGIARGSATVAVR